MYTCCLSGDAVRLTLFVEPTGICRLIADLKEAGRFATSWGLEAAASLRSLSLTSWDRDRERDRLNLGD